MTPIEWLNGRSLLVAEPAWSNYMDTNVDMYIYYYIEVTNPEKARIFLIQRGFTFDDEWKDNILSFIQKDVVDVDAQGSYTDSNSGFRARGITPEQMAEQF